MHHGQISSTSSTEKKDPVYTYFVFVLQTGHTESRLTITSDFNGYG